MAMKLWPYGLKTGSPLGDAPVPAGGVGWFVGERMLQHRDRSKWNPPAAPAIGAARSDADVHRGEPHWADTQPWWHD